MRAVLLDPDDTLLANRAAEREMLEQLGAEIAAELPAFDREQLVPRFLRLREAHFRRVLEGEWDVPAALDGLDTMPAWPSARTSPSRPSSSSTAGR